MGPPELRLWLGEPEPSKVGLLHALPHGMRTH